MFGLPSKRRHSLAQRVSAGWEITKTESAAADDTVSMSTTGLNATLTEAELKLLQALVYQECGMHFDERRAHFLQDRLQRRLKECQLDSFYSYYRLLTSREGKAELGA